MILSIFDWIGLSNQIIDGLAIDIDNQNIDPLD